MKLAIITFVYVLGSIQLLWAEPTQLVALAGGDICAAQQQGVRPWYYGVLLAAGWFAIDIGRGVIDSKSFPRSQAYLCKVLLVVAVALVAMLLFYLLRKM